MELSAPADDGGMPFRLACERGHAELMSLLLARGVDPAEERDECEMTGLIRAAEGGDDEEVARVLIQDGRYKHPTTRTRRESGGRIGWAASIAKAESLALDDLA